MTRKTRTVDDELTRLDADLTKIKGAIIEAVQLELANAEEQGERLDDKYTILNAQTMMGYQMQMHQPQIEAAVRIGTRRVFIARARDQQP